MNRILSTTPGATSRRLFLRRSAQMAAFAGTPFAANLMALGAASAQTAGDHKALVCIFLLGGNDQSNLVVPSSGSAYASYQAARPSLALPAAQLVPIAPAGFTGPTLGLHPALAPLKPLMDAQKLAIVANVGPLAAPTTKAQWNRGEPTVGVPAQLFSHADQQGAWMTGLPDRATATGWLGRIGDLTAAAYNPGSGVSMAMSIAGNTIMLAGDSTVQYQLNNQGAVKVDGLDALYSQAIAGTTMRRLMTDNRAHLFENEHNKIAARAIASESLVRNALSTTALNTAFPSTGLGGQLRMVARLIAARSALGQRRQVFFVQSGGWDFHDALLSDQQTRLAELAAAMAAFQAAMGELRVEQQVTTFTASDFGRALQHNGRGSDHGWGGHHFVMGGAVRGNRVYGNFPTVALGGPEDAGQGRLIPTTAIDEYAATLGRWFGVPATNLPYVLPNIGRFARSDLGFLG
jgi:uncharacterized protein (DUF1501 family)